MLQWIHSHDGDKQRVTSLILNGRLDHRDRLVFPFTGLHVPIIGQQANQNDRRNSESDHC